jgi:2-dehydropantoate 2-reductase
VGVLGPGGVGGALAVHLVRAGIAVVCIARSSTANAIDRGGLTLDHDGRTLEADPYGTPTLDGAVDLLLITVKAPQLDDALGRIEKHAVRRAVILPLMNGLEHVSTIRARFPGRVAAGSIGSIQAYRRSPTRIVQGAGSPLISMASHELPGQELERTAELLDRAGVRARVGDSEQDVLWEKAARLAPLAVVTSLTGGTVGDARNDPQWGPLLEQAIHEACAVATADGAPQDAAAQIAVVERLPADTIPSTARDVAAGRPSELDAIAGSVVRAGRRLGVPTPTLEELLDRCQAS